MGHWRAAACRPLTAMGCWHSRRPPPVDSGAAEDAARAADAALAAAVAAATSACSSSSCRGTAFCCTFIAFSSCIRTCHIIGKGQGVGNRRLAASEAARVTCMLHRHFERAAVLQSMGALTQRMRFICSCDFHNGLGTHMGSMPMGLACTSTS